MLVVGNAILDEIVLCGTIDGMDAKVMADEWHVRAGGQAMNTAINLARMGEDVVFHGALADDAAGRTLRSAR
ncbi:MAG: PfkB family carbohydrate kinase [Erythrobacter sp.]|nr:PfkB family carbohydrate kinase [Erythrobacter sp.]